MDPCEKDLVRASIQPLSPDLWLGRLGFLREHIFAGTIETEPALRHAFHLLQLAPGPFADMLGDCDEDSFEHLLENKLYDAAAGKLTASSFLDIFVNVPDGHASVEIKSEVYDLRIEAVAKDKANAMLIAWVELILNTEKAALNQEPILTGPVPRKRRSAPHPQSTWH